MDGMSAHVGTCMGCEHVMHTLTCVYLHMYWSSRSRERGREGWPCTVSHPHHIPLDVRASVSTGTHGPSPVRQVTSVP